MTFGDEKWELIKQSQLLKIKSQILSNLFNEKYGLGLGEFKNTTGTERVNWPEWKQYESVLIRVISKLNEQSAVTNWIYSFWTYLAKQLFSIVSTEEALALASVTLSPIAGFS